MEVVYLLKQINLNKELLEEIIDICKRHAEIEKVVLFGSRARGDNSPKSDIDLAIYANSNFSDFIEDMENNTRTLLEFDFSNMRTVKDEFFIEQVNKEGIIIYEKC
ncbi:Nucleotidyltransferase domain-containing protein [Clostridium intestinale DSM 6191]|uniref:Nucleotidyltransferase domain-containing protein n=1 Tax=Clostridium intestinale DSM 6191 TaxID=1121320 RepID=A0A1M5WE09_9CLOT|nr:Nucleotidyltransferase domain-containing protein [Clostridium intestinale DSM 6191]